MERIKMASLLESLSEYLGGDNLSQMSQQLDANEDTTKSAISAALPVLIGALSRTAGGQQKESTDLSNILKHHADRSVIEDPQGYLRSKRYEQPQLSEDVLKQILGKKQERVQRNVSHTSGLDPAMVGKLMKMLAPIVLAGLAKHQQSHGMDDRSLQNSLQHEHEQIEQHGGGLLGQLLDQDADGDFDLSDIAKVAMKNLFRN
jgi:hypothetical protein